MTNQLSDKLMNIQRDKMADVDEAVPVAKPKRRRSTPEKWNKKNKAVERRRYVASW